MCKQGIITDAATSVCHIRHLNQDDTFNTTWWSVLSIDKLVTWQHLPIERTGHHVVLKASSCSRSLLKKLNVTEMIICVHTINGVVRIKEKLCSSLK